MVPVAFHMPGRPFLCICSARTLSVSGLGPPGLPPSRSILCGMSCPGAAPIFPRQPDPSRWSARNREGVESATCAIRRESNRGCPAGVSRTSSIWRRTCPSGICRPGLPGRTVHPVMHPFKFVRRRSRPPVPWFSRNPPGTRWVASWRGYNP